jgi:hypothetical protein
VEAEAEKVVGFLQRAYYAKIEEIVLDFVKDVNGHWWLLGCKGFRLDRSILLARELRLKERETKSAKEILAEKAQRNDDRLSAMHCKVCLLPYHTTELQNSLPFKMLMQYKQHTYLSGRGVLDLSHLRVLSVSFLFHTVRI